MSLFGKVDLNFKIASDFDFVIKLLRGSYFGIYNYNSFFNFYMGGISQNYSIVNENHKIRTKHFKNYLAIFFSYILDNLKYLKSKI